MSPMSVMSTCLLRVKVEENYSYLPETRDLRPGSYHYIRDGARRNVNSAQRMLSGT